MERLVARFHDGSAAKRDFDRVATRHFEMQRHGMAGEFRLLSPTGPGAFVSQYKDSGKAAGPATLHSDRCPTR